MFFRKKESHAATASTTMPAAAAEPQSHPDLSGEVSTVLDAIGGVIASLGRYPIDLPQRPAEKTSKEMTAWQRHATMGTALDEGGDQDAVGLADRDWRGLVRAVTELRRDEQTSVTAMVDELRGALWTCVSAVHEAVSVDSAADNTTETQMNRMRRALSTAPVQTIKQDLLQAITEIDRALRERREEQQKQYRALAQTLDTLGKQLEEAKRESATDPLTGTGNRKHFDLMASRAVQLHSLSRDPVSLLMVDMNKLKMINDSYGHLAGDAAIVSLATAMFRVFMRQADVVCRYGGDEFAVILQGADARVAKTLAQRLIETVRGLPLPDPAMEFALGVSVGVAQLSVNETVAQWVARADGAMYAAKRMVSGGVCIADSTVPMLASNGAARGS